MVALVFVITFGAAFWLSQNAANIPLDNSIRIELSSAPFPLIVGQNRLLVTLTRNGEPVDGATVNVEALREMQGQVPLTATTSQSANGTYTLPMIWSAADRWTIRVSAASGEEAVEDEFTVFVFSVPEPNPHELTTYASVKSISAAQAEHPEEFWIVIPQGTAAQIREGHGDDVMPNEIRLYIGGQNTLVLRNNDLADHTVGPFFVRAGETLRQTFNTPQIYEGVCSVRHDAVVRIIVE